MRLGAQSFSLCTTTRHSFSVHFIKPYKETDLIVDQAGLCVVPSQLIFYGFFCNSQFILILVHFKHVSSGLSLMLLLCWGLRVEHVFDK